MVTPFAWSQPHPVNDHVAGAAEELRRRGHEVVVLAPSGRATELAAGRRALKQLGRKGTPLGNVVALGPAIPISRKSRLGVPIGARANLELALSRDRFDVVHGHEPGLPSLSYLALRDARGLAVATFHSPERLGYPPGKKQRERLLGRVDALTAVSEETADGGRRAVPRRLSRFCRTGSTWSSSGPGSPAHASCSSGAAEELPRLRAAFRALADLPGWELTRPAHDVPRRTSVRPARAARPRHRAHRARRTRPRADALAGAAGLVPAARGNERLPLEAAAAGVSVVDPPGAAEQPELVGAALARLGEDEAWRARSAATARQGGRASGLRAARRTSWSEPTPPSSASAGRLPHRPPTRSPTAPSCSPTCTCTRSTRTTAPFPCRRSSTTRRASAWARSRSPTTTSSPAPGRPSSSPATATLIVIPGEEVKTDAGEVIGLFLERGDPARHVDGRHDRGDPRAGRRRLSPPPLRPAAHDPGRDDAAPPPGRDRRLRGLQRPPPVRRASTTRRCASRASTT